jgi:His-Xaa-Ser system protein HxsD
MDDRAQTASVSPAGTAVEFDSTIVSIEAAMKASYWLVRDLLCEFRSLTISRFEVLLSTRGDSVELRDLRDIFVQSATDFALRERIESQTANVRDLLLAKAFSEAGILEDEPSGVFGDSIEESKPDGMFKILSNQS